MPHRVPTPKRTRNLDKSRKEILNVAFMEVFTRGFQGVSVDDIVKKTSLTKGAFYHHFPTKLDLGYALVDDVIKPIVTERFLNPLVEFKNPIEGILKTLKVGIAKAEGGEVSLGCPLNNLVQEMSTVDPEFHERLQSVLQYWIDEIEIQLKRAKKSGYLKSNVNTAQAALFIVMAHEGIFGMVKGLRNPKASEMLYDSMKSYFASISAI